MLPPWTKADRGGFLALRFGVDLRDTGHRLAHFRMFTNCRPNIDKRKLGCENIILFSPEPIDDRI